jgi:hypothetical protein
MFNKILIILLSLIIVSIPSIKLFSDFYYSFVLLAVILIVIMLILLIKIPFKLKIVFIVTILIIFKNNLSVNGKTILSIINAAYIKPLKTRTDDSKLRSIVEYSFDKVLILKKDFSKLPDKPTIFVCNYCNDRVENLACILIPKDIAIMMRDGLKKTAKLDKLVQWPIFTKEKNNYEHTKSEIVKHTKEGRSVLSYITKYPRLRPNYIQSIRSGLFNISKELNIPITLVAIDYADINNCIMHKQNFNIVIGDTFNVENVSESIYKTKKFYKKTMSNFMKNKYKGI